MGIKRHPQEIADFFKGYVAQDENGSWYLFNTKPAINDVGDRWVAIGMYSFIIPTAIKTPEGHDWHTIYEPQPKDPIEIFNEIQARGNDIAPHQSEVHAHKEYVLLGEFDPSKLGLKVNEYLEKGFKLYGNPWTGPDTRSCGYIHYQAMVRGI